MPVVLKKCTCTSVFQDLEYGTSIRVHNASHPSGGKFIKAGCTVCGKEKDIVTAYTPEVTKQSKKQKKDGKKSAVAK